MENSKYIVEVKNLSVEFRTENGVVKALNGMELQLERGRTLGLVGETGAGKTTLGLSMLQLIQTPPGRITSGEIYFNGESILDKSEEEMEEIRGEQISMIFQDPMTALNPVFTVEDQIAESIEIHEKISRADALEKTHRMLELVGIPRERGKEYPHQFSGGMKQRVVIAIALACSPAVLIADEPTTALDVTIQAQVLDMMRQLKDQYQMSLLMITHDLGIVAEICDEVSVVYAGAVVEHGTLRDVFKSTLHPYTEGLFNSLPNLEHREAKLKPIKGMMPDPTNLPEGCAFCDRCNYAMDICRTQKPLKAFRNEKHYVRCHLYDDGNLEERRLERK